VIVDGAQRWRAGRASYRPAGEVIDPRRYEVATIDGPGADNIARAFVVAHHYSASYPAARERIGLYQGGALVGLAAWLGGALKAVTRTLKHTGNLRYTFGLTPTMKRLVASSTSYPPQPYPQLQISAARSRT
jgi:hypothetical protein